MYIGLTRHENCRFPKVVRYSKTNVLGKGRKAIVKLYEELLVYLLFWLLSPVTLSIVAEFFLQIIQSF